MVVVGPAVVVVVVVPVKLVVGQLDPWASLLTMVVPGQHLYREARHGCTVVAVVALPACVRVRVKVRARARVRVGVRVRARVRVSARVRVRVRVARTPGGPSSC